MQQAFQFLFLQKSSLKKLRAAFPKNEQRKTTNEIPNNQQPTINNRTAQRYKLALVLLLLAFGLKTAQAQTQPSLPSLVPVSPSAKPQKPKTVREKVILQLRASAADKEILKNYKLKREQPDSLTALQTIRDLVLDLQRDAYLTASADSFFLKNDTVFVDLFIGQQFKWVQLKNGNLSEGLLQKSGFREKFYRNKPFRPEDFSKLQKRVVEFAENSGYPFASIKLDSVQISGNEITAIAKVNRGPLITFDSIVVEGKTKTRSKFLSRYLQIRPGQPYEHRKVESSLRLLRQLPYLQVSRTPQVRFAENKARLYYFIEDRNANQLDALIGILPPEEGAADQKVLLIWEGNLNIRNIRGSGIQLGLQARKVDRSSQILDANYLQPNILGSPLEMGLKKENKIGAK